MIRAWLDRKVAPVMGFVPAGKRLYCVGDIHGRADLLEELHSQIVLDSQGFTGQCHIIYLGDYVDRGDGSCQVLDLLISHQLSDFETCHLLGNHEQAMLDFLKDPLAMAPWLTWGGADTLRSYEIVPSPFPTRAELVRVHKLLKKALPTSHEAFLQSCSASHSEGSYYFVHAGIRPGVALEKQSVEDKLWIRDEFLQSKKNHGAIIVHGHNISPEVEILPNRIGIDTGAYSSGVLTSLVLEGESLRLLQTGGAG